MSSSPRSSGLRQELAAGDEADASQLAERATASRIAYGRASYRTRDYRRRIATQATTPVLRIAGAPSVRQEQEPRGLESQRPSTTAPARLVLLPALARTTAAELPQRGVNAASQHRARVRLVMRAALAVSRTGRPFRAGRRMNSLPQTPLETP